MPKRVVNRSEAGKQRGRDRAAARQRALGRLAALHREEFRGLYAAEVLAMQRRAQEGA